MPKYFITADIEKPNLSYYAEIDEEIHTFGFIYCWARAEKEGLPPPNALYFTDRDSAEMAATQLRDCGAGIPFHADTIEVTELFI